MERFRYIALDASGEVRQGEVLAANKGEAEANLEARKFRPVRLDAAGGVRFAEFLNRDISLSPGLTRTEQALFARSLASLLEAGLAVDAALLTVNELQRRSKAKEITADIHRQVKSGISLSQAVSTHGVTFSAEFVAMIRAGEESGRLPGVLGELAEYLERSNLLRAKVRSAMYYPAFLLTMAIAAIILVVTLVLPQFEPLFRSAGTELPLLTRWVRSFGLAVVDYYWLFLLVPVTIVVVVAQARRSARGAVALGGFWLSLPVLGTLILNIDAARFARVLGAQLEGGVGIARALETSGNALGNAVLAGEVAKLRDAVKKGTTFAVALQASQRFPHIFVQLSRVGEEAGMLDSMLLRIAKFYDEQVTIQLDRLIALLVPVITLIMGLVVGVIVFSVLAAILGLNQLL